MRKSCMDMDRCMVLFQNVNECINRSNDMKVILDGTCFNVSVYWYIYLFFLALCRVCGVSYHFESDIWGHYCFFSLSQRWLSHFTGIKDCGSVKALSFFIYLILSLICIICFLLAFHVSKKVKQCKKERGICGFKHR